MCRYVFSFVCWPHMRKNLQKVKTVSKCQSKNDTLDVLHSFVMCFLKKQLMMQSLILSHEFRGHESLHTAPALMVCGF